jgi:hypothetical protein
MAFQSAGLWFALSLLYRSTNSLDWFQLIYVRYFVSLFAICPSYTPAAIADCVFSQRWLISRVCRAPNSSTSVCTWLGFSSSVMDLRTHSADSTPSAGGISLLHRLLYSPKWLLLFPEWLRVGYITCTLERRRKIAGVSHSNDLGQRTWTGTYCTGAYVG